MFKNNVTVLLRQELPLVPPIGETNALQDEESVRKWKRIAQSMTAEAAEKKLGQT